MIINFLYPQQSEIKYHIDTYPDGQKQLVIDSELNRREPISIYTRIASMDDLFIILQVKDICDRNGIWIDMMRIAYLLCGRTDRLFNNVNSAISLKVILDMLTAFKGTIIRIFEPHNVNSDIILTGKEFLFPEFGSTFYSEFSSYTRICPDTGAKERYGRATNTIVCKKSRTKDGITIELETPIDERFLTSPGYVVIDDLCDGGGTFFAIHKALPDDVKKNVHLCVAHAIQQDPIIELSKLYKTVTITNSFKNWEDYYFPSNVKVIKLWNKND